MKTLRLTIKKKWFDMILKGEKKEEYREVKMHWINRFITLNFGHRSVRNDNNVIELIMSSKDHFSKNRIKSFDIVEFTNGYGKDKPQITLECRGIEIGKGKPKWGAPEEDVFIIKLGKEVSRSNL